MLGKTNGASSRVSATMVKLKHVENFGSAIGYEIEWANHLGA